MTPRASVAARTEPPRVVVRDPRTTPRTTPRSVPPLERQRPVAATSPAPALRSRHRLRPVAVAIGLVVVSLLGVVGGSMQLASGQLRLEQVQSLLAQRESAYAAALVSEAAATSPQALARLAGLQSPRQILLIPSVSLSHRLAAPTLSSAPGYSLTPGR